MKFTKRTIAGAVAGFVLAGGAAFAAVSLWGSGHAAVAATQSQGLVVDNVRLAHPLVPNGTSDALGDVYNPNDFSVKVTGVIVWDANQHVTDCTDTQSVGSVHVNGGTHANYVQDATHTSVAGTLLAPASELPLAPHQKLTITVPAAVKQDSGADQFCGFTADLGVQAETTGN